MKRIKILFVKMREKKNNFRYLSDYLRPGVYSLYFNSYSKFEFKCLFSLRRLFGLVRIKNNNTSFLLGEKGYYSFGLYKVVAWSDFDKNAFIKFKKPEKYISAKDRYIKFNNYFLINHCDYFGWDDKNSTCFSSKVCGTKELDNSRVLRLVEDLVRYSINFKDLLYDKIINNSGEEVYIPFVVSHGDFGGNNIIWNAHNYTVIDLDDLSYKPFFYDLCYLLLTCDNKVFAETVKGVQFNVYANEMFEHFSFPSDVDLCFSLFFDYCSVKLKYNSAFSLLITRFIHVHENFFDKTWPKTLNSILNVNKILQIMHRENL